MKKITLVLLPLCAFILLACTDGLVDKQTEDTRNEDTVVLETPDSTIVMSNQEIPESYPEHLCPIYEPSDVLGAMESGDAELTIVIVSLLSEDSVEDVLAFYESKNPQEILGREVLLFSTEDSKEEVTVQVGSAEGEEVDEKYNTLIVLSATINK